MTATWNAFLASLTSSGPAGYTYPVTDNETDRRLEQQDAGMRAREQSLYREWIGTGWRRALDFGCGTGANFACFDQGGDAGRVLVGLEPDAGRLAAARAAASRLQHIQAIVGAVPLDMVPAGSLDLVLVSQVFGHVPRPALPRILAELARIVPPGGRLGVAVPVVGPAFRGDPAAGDWDGATDFFHAVHLNRSPFATDFRVRIDAEAFDGFAAAPQAGVLPVRGFALPAFPPLPAALPAVLAAGPPTLLAAAVGFRAERAVLYSVHGRGANEAVPAVGDVFVYFVRE